METYNPINPRHKGLLEKATEFYWSNQEACDCALFLGVCGLAVRMLVAIA